jgi:hypothetical protein
MVRRLEEGFALLFLAAAVALLAPPLTRAQMPTPPQGVDKLKRSLKQPEETTRQQIEALNRRIAQQEDEITQLRQQAQLPPAASTPQLIGSQQRQTTREIQGESFSRESESAPASTTHRSTPRCPAISLSRHAGQDQVRRLRQARRNG